MPELKQGQSVKVNGQWATFHYRIGKGYMVTLDNGVMVTAQPWELTVESAPIRKCEDCRHRPTVPGTFKCEVCEVAARHPRTYERKGAENS